jgi:P27 family predicted phage terminase small subunit
MRRGNPGKRRLSADQSEGTAGDTAVEAALNLLIPEKPDWLTKQASKIWDDLLPKMLAGNAIRSVDWFSLGDYCQLTAEMERCHRVLKTGNFLKKNSNNTQSKREEVGLLKELRKEQLKLADVLGLTPKARKQQNITLNQPKPKDAAEARKNRILGN